jgi:hypothetical protein
MLLNDEADDEQRQQLLPFVARLTCADTARIEWSGKPSGWRLLSRVRPSDNGCPLLQVAKLKAWFAPAA